MEGKEAIIQRILDDAAARAENIRLTAEENCAETLRDAEEWAELYSSKQAELLREEVEEIHARRETVADLDIRKAILFAKQEVLGEVYARALEKLVALDHNTYIALIAKMLEQCADRGDLVVLAKGAPVTAGEVGALSVCREKKLSVSDEPGAFSGGMMLLNEKCDKDLTFETLLNEIQPEIESETADRLFG